MDGYTYSCCHCSQKRRGCRETCGNLPYRAACWCAVLACVSCLLKLPCLVVSAHPSRCLRCSSARWSQLQVEHFPCVVSKWSYSTSTFLMAFCSSGLGVVCKIFLAFSCFFLLPLLYKENNEVNKNLKQVSRNWCVRRSMRRYGKVHDYGLWDG